MTFWRVSCSVCGKTFSLLQRFIHLGRYQTKTNELEKLIVEAASETNYRRAVQELARDGKLPVSFHTAHGWMLRTDCDEIDISNGGYYHRRRNLFPGKLGGDRLGCDQQTVERTRDEVSGRQYFDL